jgi:hypothetical protein
MKKAKPKKFKNSAAVEKIKQLALDIRREGVSENEKARILEKILKFFSGKMNSLRNHYAPWLEFDEVFQCVLIRFWTSRIMERDSRDGDTFIISRINLVIFYAIIDLIRKEREKKYIKLIGRDGEKKRVKIGVRSLFDPTSKNDKIRLIDVVPDRCGTEDEFFSKLDFEEKKKNIRKTIDYTFRANGKAHDAMMFYCTHQPTTLKEAAERYDLTENYVRDLRKKLKQQYERQVFL